MSIGKKQAAILTAAIATTGWLVSASHAKITITGPNIYVPTVTVTNEPDVASLNPLDVVYLSSPNYGMRRKLVSFNNAQINYPNTTLNGTLSIDQLGVGTLAPHSAFATLTADYTPGPGDPPLNDLFFIQEVITNFPKTGKPNSVIDTPDELPFYPIPADKHVNGQLKFEDSPRRPCRKIHPPGPDHITWAGELMLASLDRNTGFINVYDGIGWGWKLDSAPTKVGATGQTPQVPPSGGQFKSTPEDDAHYATPLGDADITGLTIVPNGVPAVVPVGANENTFFPADLSATLNLAGQPTPILLHGSMGFTLLNRANHPTGTFSGQILNMVFNGTVNTPSGPVTMILASDQARASTGQTEVSGSQIAESGDPIPVPGAPFAMESFFDVFTKVSFNGGANFSNSTGSVHLDLMPVPKGWKVNGGGTWEAAANWLGGIPNSVGATASFNGALITAANTPAIVTLAGEHTVGTILFDNTLTNGTDPHGYILSSAGGGALKLDSGTDQSFIRVNAGRHAIQVPLNIASDTTLTVAYEAILDIDTPTTVAPGKMLSKGDAGAVVFSGGLILSPGSTLSVDAGWATSAGIDGDGEVRVGADGWLSAAHIRASSLRIQTGGTVRITPNGTPSAASWVSSVDLDGGPDAWGGKLDLRDNDLVVQAGAGEGPAALARLLNQIAQGRNGDISPWKGQGITSLTAAADPTKLTGLGIVLNGLGGGLAGADILYTVFDGMAVDEDSVLIKYTWNGDTDLNGLVDADDFFRIDSGFANILTGWRNGDFDYSGQIDADDYFLIDSAFAAQTGTLGASGVSVPEPGVSALFLCAVAAISRRKRRR